MRLLLLVACGVMVACRPAPTPPVPAYACTESSCERPACCNEACGEDGGCCEGTVCSMLGRCVPKSCANCPAGCSYKATDCSATCNAPTCCLMACTTNADCCAGTECTSSGGVKKCFPFACRDCNGLKPLCKADSACGVSCLSPASCGKACMVTADCGDAISTCRAFPDGTRACAPVGLDSVCAACPDRCAFDKSTCSAKCIEPDGGSPACKACCDACIVDGGIASSCCDGNSCFSLDGGSQGQCRPTTCATCGGACNVTCPAQ